jgi:hypothetical protein
MCRHLLTSYGDFLFITNHQHLVQHSNSLNTAITVRFGIILIIYNLYVHTILYKPPSLKNSLNIFIISVL